MDLLPLLNDSIECSCHHCVSACNKKPGWFLPEEIKAAADLLNLSVEDFFNQYLSVDYFGNPDSFTFVLAPATENSKPGQEYPLDPTGRCIFLKDGKCSIHAAKPFECKFYDHRKTKVDTSPVHEAIAKAWISHKDRIAELLGREPTVEPPNPFELMQFMLKMMKGNLP
jgi:Fe-S-cluster containining protein